MDYQAIGIFSALAIFMAIFIYVLMSRSKDSNTKPEIEMKEE
jgi:hypothetical protein